MKAYKIRLYDSDHNDKIDKDLDIACEIYNHCIALHRRYFKLYKKHLSLYDLQKHITKLKRTHPHWKKLNSQAIQDVAERIERSYKNFFLCVKAGRKAAPPHFRKREKYYSFTLKQTGYKLHESHVVIMGKKFKFFKSQDIKGNIKIVTVKKVPSGKYFLFVVTDAETPKRHARTGDSVGMDFGLKDFLVLSNGEKISSPLYLKQSLKDLKKASRSFSLKQKGSKNREKAYHRLMLVYEKVSNKRTDFFFKLANSLCERFDTIAIEDLALNGMKRLWGRKVSDLAYGDFVRILEYTATKYGTKVVKIDRFEPTSKVCSRCGEKVNLLLDDRQWVCPKCGTLHDRDINAAINIMQAGHRLLQECHKTPSEDLLGLPGADMLTARIPRT